jgi:hypothetical protein
MNNQGSQREKQTPFQAKDTAYAALHGSKVGVITDINNQGLSFRYFHDATHVADDTKKVLTVSIFNQDGFALHHIPCKVTTDDSMLSEYTFRLVKMYKCSLLFGELTAGQQSQLASFITHFNKRKKQKDLPVDHP